MKILAINASPKKKGSTAFVLNKILEQLQLEKIKYYCLGEMKIKYCLGCRRCEKEYKCIQKDDMNIFYSEIQKCDFFIIASPSYWGDITGQLKVFIDRNLHLCNTKTGKSILPKNKKGIAIAIRSGKNNKENVHIIDTIEHYFQHLDIVPISNLSITQASSLKNIRDNSKVLKKIEKFGLKLKNEIVTKN